MGRVLLLMPKATYRAEDFLEGARAAGVEPRVGSDVCHVLHDRWATGALSLDFERPEEAADRVVEACIREPVDALVPVTESASVVASWAARRLGLAHNPPEAAEIARNKRRLRTCLAGARVGQPGFTPASLDDDPDALARDVSYPCVLKPVLLSASRGVVRADDPHGFVQAFARIRRLMGSRQLQGIVDPDRRRILIERYVPGFEVSLEGLLDRGRLRTLAVFDKPDPLHGPYFEETLFVTPSRLPEAWLERIRGCAQRAAEAIGLETGPIHAELRLPGVDSPDAASSAQASEPVVLEVAARSIGGLCGRALRFARRSESATATPTLEELIVRQAVGHDLGNVERQRDPSGVMMIPVPRAGVLRAVHGMDDAASVEGIDDVVLGTPLGSRLVPLPEGSDYLGFLFARGQTPQQVEATLRQAHAQLSFQIAPTLGEELDVNSWE